MFHSVDLRSSSTGMNSSIAQSVMCLTADPGVVSSIPIQSHTFLEIDREIISTAFLLPSAYSRRVVVSYMQKYVPRYWLTAKSNLPRKKGATLESVRQFI